jgi:hypothetical protein
MTAPAIAQPTCPVCSGQMWDQKNGKYPWKPGTPIFKCRDKECAPESTPRKGRVQHAKGTAQRVRRIQAGRNGRAERSYRARRR